MDYHPRLIAALLWIILLAALNTGGHASYVKGKKIERRQAESDIGIKKCDGIRQLFADGLMKVDDFVKRLRDCNGNLDREPYVDEVARLQAQDVPQQSRYQTDQSAASINQPKLPIIDRNDDVDKQGVARMMIHPNSPLQQESFFGYRRSANDDLSNRIVADPDRYGMVNRDTISMNNYGNPDNLDPHQIDESSLHQATPSLISPIDNNRINPQRADPNYQHPFQIVKKDAMIPIQQENLDEKLESDRMQIPSSFSNPLEERLQPHNNYYGAEGRYIQHDNPRSEVDAAQDTEENPAVFNYRDLLTLGLHDTGSFMDAGPLNGGQQSLTLNGYESLVPSDTQASVSRSYIDNNRENLNAEQQSMPLDHIGLIQKPSHVNEAIVRSASKLATKPHPGELLSSALAKPKIHSEKITAANLATIFKELDEDNSGRRISDVSKKDSIEDIGSQLSAVQPINIVKDLNEPVTKLSIEKSEDNLPNAEPKESGFNLYQLNQPHPLVTKNGTDTAVNQNKIKKSMLIKTDVRKTFNLAKLKFGMNNGNNVK